MAAARRKSAAARLISPRLVADYQFKVHGEINHQERIRDEDAASCAFISRKKGYSSKHR
jgi:hypothetical protein